MRKFIFLISLAGLILVARGAEGATIGDSRSFNVDSYYDIISREEVVGAIQKISRWAYFYCDENWWNTLDKSKQNQIKEKLDLLSMEFDQKIYPILTKTFGSEWKPGIDNDSRITVLIHPMKQGSGGYFNNGDEYLRVQNPRSNEKEMIYLNADYFGASLAKSFLAHELVHLITFNQKEKMQGKEEDIWLNEARAEYAPTLLGYDSEYQNSNLEARVKTFLKAPSDSITEWQYQKEDYGALNVFIQYLVEHYGIEILTDSLKSSKTGIESINEALKKNGFEQNFSQIFTDWTIAVLVNNCALGKNYCYQDNNLKNLQISPSLNFLPLNGKSTLGVSQTTKNWAGNWFKLIGGQGNLKVEFIGNPENLFKVVYLSKDFSNNYSLNFIELNEYQRGEALISGLGTKIDSLIIIPSVQSKISNFLNPDQDIPFFWSVSITDEQEKKQEPEKDISKYLEKPVFQMSQKEILLKISEIEKLLSQLKAQLAKLIEPEPEPAAGTEISCQKFTEDLFYGLKNDSRVKCLQEFLKSQGLEIYPEGLVTGNFLTLTKKAVTRFQEKYASEILAPWSLTQGTGFVGSTTRAKLNELLTGLTKRF